MQRRDLLTRLLGGVGSLAALNQGSRILIYIGCTCSYLYRGETDLPNELNLGSFFTKRRKTEERDHECQSTTSKVDDCVTMTKSKEVFPIKVGLFRDRLSDHPLRVPLSIDDQKPKAFSVGTLFAADVGGGVRGVNDAMGAFQESPFVSE